MGGLRAAPLLLAFALAIPPTLIGCGEELPQAGTEIFMCRDYRGACSDRVIALAKSADDAMWVAVFSFTHEDIAESLIAAAGRGADVAVVVETRQETPVVPRLVAGGVRVRQDGNGSSMHHKFAVVDGDVVATGSFNWTANADYHNDENLVILHSEEVASDFAAEFLRVWDLGEEP